MTQNKYATWEGAEVYTLVWRGRGVEKNKSDLVMAGKMSQTAPVGVLLVHAYDDNGHVVKNADATVIYKSFPVEFMDAPILEMLSDKYHLYDIESATQREALKYYDAIARTPLHAKKFERPDVSFEHDLYARRKPQFRKPVKPTTVKRKTVKKSKPCGCK